MKTTEHPDPDQRIEIVGREGRWQYTLLGPDGAHRGWGGWYASPEAALQAAVDSLAAPDGE